MERQSTPLSIQSATKLTSTAVPLLFSCEIKYRCIITSEWWSKIFGLIFHSRSRPSERKFYTFWSSTRWVWKQSAVSARQLSSGSPGYSTKAIGRNQSKCWTTPRYSWTSNSSWVTCSSQLNDTTSTVFKYATLYYNKYQIINRKGMRFQQKPQSAGNLSAGMHSN